MSLAGQWLSWRYRVRELPTRALRVVAWRMPRSLVYWAFIRVVTYRYDGNPGDRNCLEAMRTWRHE